MRYLYTAITGLLFLLCQSETYAEQVFLKNKDIITDELAGEDEEAILIETEAMGRVSINKKFVEAAVGKPEEEKKSESGRRFGEAIWDRKVTAGYNALTGNTRTRQLSAGLFINRNRYHMDEVTAKGDIYYSSSDRKMNTQKWYGMGRYAFSFGKTRMWYNFYKVEAGHDRFADIDYRIVPTGGLGYWLYDLPRLKVMAEAGVGFEHTDYRSQTKDRNEAVLVPRAFLEKKLFANSKISQDIYFYNPVDDLSDYRLRSETVFTVSLNEKLSLRLSLTDDYNSKPPKDTRKNDMRFVSGLAYSF